MEWRASLLEMKPVTGRTEVHVLTVLALLAAAVSLGLTVPSLGDTSMWLDEAFSVVDAGRKWADILTMHSDRGATVHPPLYSVLLRTSISVCGTGETCARLPSALAAAVACGLFVMIAGRVFGWVAAVSAAWLWPTLPYLLKYADQARGYTLLLMLSAIALSCAGRVIGWWGTARWRTHATWGLALSVTAMTATHLLAATFIVPLAGALWLSARRDPAAKKALRNAVMLAAAMITPLAIIVGLAVFGDDTSRFASAPGAAKGLERMAHALISLSEYTWTTPALIGAAAVLTPRRRRFTVLLGCLVAGLPLVPLLVRAPSHFIVLRYFMPSVGVVGLLACAGIGAIAAAPGRIPTGWTQRIPAAVLVVLGLAAAAVPTRLLGVPHAERLRKRADKRSFEPWNESAAWINARTEDGAAVVLVPHRILWPTTHVYPLGAAVLADDPDALRQRLERDAPPVVFVLWSHVTDRERQKRLAAVFRTLGRARYRATDNAVFGRRTIIVKEYRAR